MKIIGPFLIYSSPPPPSLFHPFSSPWVLLVTGYISTSFILPGSSVQFPSLFWLGLCWDRYKTDHRTWISSQNVMPLTCGIATLSLRRLCLRFWKQHVYLGQYCLFDYVHIYLWKCGHLWTRCILHRNHITIISASPVWSLRAVTVRSDRKPFLEL